MTGRTGRRARAPRGARSPSARTRRCARSRSHTRARTAGANHPGRSQPAASAKHAPRAFRRAERRGARRPRRGVLAKRPVHRVQQPETFGHPVAQVTGVALERLHAPDIDIRQIHRRMAADDPFRQHLARAAGRLDADRVEAAGDEEARELGRRAEQIAIVRREALRAAEELADAGALERGIRRIASSRIGMKWSQSSGSSPNSKSSGMPSMPHGLATGSNAPTRSLPASSLT